MDTVNIEQRLWAYIDNFSTAEEKSVVETLIRENQEWRDRYQDLLQTHQSLLAIDLEEPSLRFTKNVMEELAKHHIAPATRNYINNKIIWGIAAFFILSIAGFLLYILGQINWSVATAPSTHSGFDLAKVEYGRFFSSTVINVFMMLNVILGLMLLDRYIGKKRKNLYKAA